MVEQCVNCRFWRRPPEPQKAMLGANVGACRRYAPRPKLDTNPKGQSFGLAEVFWPAMLTDEWCGEWQCHPTRDTHTNQRA